MYTPDPRPSDLVKDELPGDNPVTPIPIEEEIEGVMKDVADPELMANVVNLDLFYGITVDGEVSVTLDMTPTSSTCPLINCTGHDTKYALDGLVNSMTISWVWLPLWTLEMITEDGREQLRAVGYNLWDGRTYAKVAGSENPGIGSDTDAMGCRVISGRTDDWKAKMPKLTTPNQVNLNYTDIGSGRPIVMIYGWPLSGVTFADSAKVLAAVGYRVITYDRRGFGQSEKPHDGYDYDILAADLGALLAGLDLHDVALLGFSMGGDEVAHHLTAHGPERVGAVILSESICPTLCIMKDNPDGTMPCEGFQELVDAHAADCVGPVGQFCGWFCSNERGLIAPEEIRQQAVEIARRSVPYAVIVAILIWTRDLCEDCRRIDASLLVIHGDRDQNAPLAKSSARAPECAQQAQLVVIEGGSYGISVFHADQQNAMVLSLLVGS